PRVAGDQRHPLAGHLRGPDASPRRPRAEATRPAAPSQRTQRPPSMAHQGHVSNGPPAASPPPAAGAVSRLYAWIVVSIRFLIVPGWIVATVAATALLPSTRQV